MSSGYKRAHSPSRRFILAHLFISYINFGPHETKRVHKYNDLGVLVSENGREERDCFDFNEF